MEKISYIYTFTCKQMKAPLGVYWQQTKPNQWVKEITLGYIGSIRTEGVFIGPHDQVQIVL